MKMIYYLIIIFYLTSCGFKAPPTPFFPIQKNPLDDEIAKRNQQKKSPTNYQQSKGEEQNAPE